MVPLTHVLLPLLFFFEGSAVKLQKSWYLIFRYPTKTPLSYDLYIFYIISLEGMAEESMIEISTHVIEQDEEVFVNYRTNFLIQPVEKELKNQGLRDGSPSIHTISRLLATHDMPEDTVDTSNLCFGKY